ncbi:2-carboxy-1,4-naphthoquinone phytyltransferase, chloroplastic [Glycine max]|nr:2-carboxy-1,4-naphthoquinone phytyltransferase, chloroplastic [Glycine max]
MTFRVKLPTRLTYSLKFDVDELASVYDFRIDKFQRQAILAFLRGFSVVVSAPTSSRKTLIGEAAAEYVNGLLSVDDRKFMKKANTMNALDDYVFKMRNALNNKNISSKLCLQEREKIKSVISKVTDLLEGDNQPYEIEVFEDHLNELVNLFDRFTRTSFAMRCSSFSEWISVNIVVERNIRSILFLVCAIICGYIYQCPPFRLSYQGLGEPLCFAAFGPFATCAFYLLHGSSSVMNHFPLSGTILSASILVGFTTSLILFCSHFHQVEGDREVGKMSPLVRLGTKKGAEVVKGAIFMLYALLVAFGLIKALPLTCIFLCALTLPMGNLVVRFVEDNYKAIVFSHNKNKIFMAKYFCVRLHALFGVALALGLVLARKSVDDPGRPPGIVLSAATSFWLPVPPKRVFDFLRDENSRNEVLWFYPLYVFSIVLSTIWQLAYFALHY